MLHRLSLCAVLCVAACGGKAAPPPPVQNAAPAEPVAAPPPPPKTETEIAMAQMESFATEMCTCTDKACADRVQADMTKWAQEMAAKPGAGEERPREQDMKRMTEMGQHYAECMTKAMTPPP